MPLRNHNSKSSQAGLSRLLSLQNACKFQPPDNRVQINPASIGGILGTEAVHMEAHDMTVEHCDPSYAGEAE